MTSPQGTPSSPSGDSPDGSPSPPEHAEQWAALTDLLDADGPEEVVSRVRALQQGMHALDDRLDEPDGDMDMDAAVREMREQLARLREQNADLADRPATDLDRSSGRELHPETEVLLGQLDAASLSEAQERVESLTAQVENLYREKEVLAEAGLMSSREALDEINRLQRECDRLRSREPDPDDASAAASPDDAIADILGIASPREARELDQAVRRLSSRLDSLLDEKETLASTLGVADADAVLDLVRSMEGQLSAFYEAHEEKGLNGHTVPTEIESILGVSNAEEARELVSYVHAMNDRLERLSAEHDLLASEGLDAEKAVAIIDSMEEQLVDLYGTADASRGASHANGTPAGAAASSVAERPASSDASIAEILGIAGATEARELDRLVRNMSRELDRLRTETERLSAAGLTAEAALQMIDSMEEQLVALYHAQDRSLKRPRVDADRLGSLAEVIGVDDPVEASAGEADPVAALVEQTAALLDAGRAALSDGDTVSSVRGLLHELTGTLEVLRSERDVHAERAERLDAIQDVLGISTLDEAQDLTSLVQNLDAQLQSLYAEREALSEVGLSSVGDAVDMIRSMEHQLEELYQEQEALQNPPRPAAPTQQDTFEQLQSLYKEQEKLRRALGVSGADDIIEMVEDLSAQLDATYGEQDAGADEAPSPQDEEAAAATRITLDSMRHQLEVLYAEREALLARGFESAEAAAARIDELQAQLQSLKEEHTAYREHLNRLEEAVGTTDVSEIARRMTASPSSDWDAAAPSFAASPPSATADDDPFVDTAPALLPDDTLAQLDAYAPDDLDALSVGVLQLDDQGTIQALNEQGRQFPGLDAPDGQTEIVGRRLFERVPSTSNALFLGRFKKGVERGAMDARFPYTFVTPGDRPTVFFVHLYRDEQHQTNWVLFRPA